MKVSIITVVYNDVRYIEDCIKSVLSQTHSDIEHIIIDGQSTDGTLDVINRYRGRVAKIISAKDKGYVHAMNKGLALATGDIIGFLHSDDIYIGDKAIEMVVNAFQDAPHDSVYADLVYVSKDNPTKIIRYWKSGQYSFDKIKWGWMPPHPTFFIKKEIYEKYGYFNTDFEIAADYEITLRFLHKFRISCCYIPQILVKMRVGGASNRNFKNIMKKSLEDYKTCKLYGVKREFSTIVLKNVAKIPQFFLKKSTIT